MLNSKKIDRDSTLCTICPNTCRYDCPVAKSELKETVTPKHKAGVIYQLAKGNIDWNPEVAEVLYHCATCKAYDTICPYDVDMVNLIESARIEAVNHNVAPESVMKFSKMYKKNKSPYIHMQSNYENLSNEPETGKKGTEVLYFIGCTNLKFNPTVVQSTLKMLRKANVDFSIHDPSLKCCGYVAYNLGLKDLALEQMKKIKSFIDQSNFKTIITGCPTCAAAFKLIYPKVGQELNVEVLHITEYFNNLLQEGKFQFKNGADIKVTYHDPCHLGRYLGVYNAPRQLIKAIPKVKLIEMEHSKEESQCCGGGGGLPITNPSVSRKINDFRIEEAIETDADSIITACPFCKEILSKNNGIEVKDIVDFLETKI